MQGQPGIGDCSAKNVSPMQRGRGPAGVEWRVFEKSKSLPNPSMYR